MIYAGDYLNDDNIYCAIQYIYALSCTSSLSNSLFAIVKLKKMDAVITTKRDHTRSSKRHSNLILVSCGIPILDNN